jgi:hypothetical protein
VRFSRKHTGDRSPHSPPSTVRVGINGRPSGLPFSFVHRAHLHTPFTPPNRGVRVPFVPFYAVSARFALSGQSGNFKVFKMFSVVGTTGIEPVTPPV